MTSKWGLWGASAGLIFCGLLGSSEAKAGYWDCVEAEVTSEIPFDQGGSDCDWIPDSGDLPDGGDSDPGDTHGGGNGDGEPPPRPIPPSQVPDMAEVLCNVEHYGLLQPDDPVNFRNVYAWSKDGNGDGDMGDPDDDWAFTYVYIDGGLDGYVETYGTTNVDPAHPMDNGSVVFASAAKPRHWYLYWTDPITLEPHHGWVDFSAFENTLFVTAHEVSHQVATEDENLADGYGMNAVERYRFDPASACGQ